MRPRLRAHLAAPRAASGRAAGPWPRSPASAAGRRRRSRRTTWRRRRVRRGSTPRRSMRADCSRSSPRRGAPARPRAAAQHAVEDLAGSPRAPTRTSAEKSKPSKPTSGDGGPRGARSRRGRSRRAAGGRTRTSKASRDGAEPLRGHGIARVEVGMEPARVLLVGAADLRERSRCAGRRAPRRGPCRGRYFLSTTSASITSSPRRAAAPACPRPPVPPRRAGVRPGSGRAARLLVQQPPPAGARPWSAPATAVSMPLLAALLDRLPRRLDGLPHRRHRRPRASLSLFSSSVFSVA